MRGLTRLPRFRACLSDGSDRHQYWSDKVPGIACAFDSMIGSLHIKFLTIAYTIAYVRSVNQGGLLSLRGVYF